MTTPPLLHAVLAFVTGYLVMWFLWGLPWPWLAGAAFVGTWAWASLQGVLGVGGFIRAACGWTLAGLTLWWVGAFVTFGSLTLGNTASHFPIGFPHVVLLAIPPAAVLWLLWRLWRRGGYSVRGGPLTPWAWLLGLLTLMTLPPVRIDCRGLTLTDSYMQYDFSGWEGVSGWSKADVTLPDRHEWPADFEPDFLSAVAVRCTRPLSFHASQPLIVLQASESVMNGREYAAVFTPFTHEKLTPWTQLKQPFGGEDWHSAYVPQLWPRVGLDTVWPVADDLPPELGAALGNRP